MEQEKLTNQELMNYLFDRLKNDNDVYAESNIGNPDTYVNFFDFEGKSEGYKLDKVYQYFIMKYIYLVDFAHPLASIGNNKVDISEYNDAIKLENDVRALGDKNYEELKEEQYKQIWIYTKLQKALCLTIRKAFPQYQYTPKQLSKEDVELVKSLSSNEVCTLMNLKDLMKIDYKKEARDFFCNHISLSPETNTIKIIDSLNTEITDIVETEVAKAKLNGNINNLIELARNERTSIYTDISFGKEWYDIQTPNIHQTKMLYKWENKADYRLFVKKLLLVDRYEKQFLQLSFYNYDYSRIVYLQKERNKEKAIYDRKLDELVKTINEYIFEELALYITEENLTNFICSIHSLFAERIVPKIVAIYNIKELKQGDIKALCFNIWEKYQELEIKLDQMLLSEFLKLQFPTLFKNTDDIKTIKKHIKREGKTIKRKNI